MFGIALLKFIVWTVLALPIISLSPVVYISRVSPAQTAQPTQMTQTTTTHQNISSSDSILFILINKMSQSPQPQNEEETPEITERDNPVITILGNDFDVDSTIVGFVIILIWCIVWRTSGLWRTLKYDYTFIVIFFAFVLFNIASIASAGNSSGGIVYELNILLTVEQMVSILFGTIVLFALFSKNLPIHENCRIVVTKLIMSAVVILTVASLWISVWNSGRAFRAIRKFKQGIYNVALALFVIIGIIFIKSNKCPSPR
jgi:hypothetical protein